MLEPMYKGLPHGSFPSGILKCECQGKSRSAKAVNFCSLFDYGGRTIGPYQNREHHREAWAILRPLLLPPPPVKKEGAKKTAHDKMPAICLCARGSLWQRLGKQTVKLPDNATLAQQLSALQGALARVPAGGAAAPVPTGGAAEPVPASPPKAAAAAAPTRLVTMQRLVEEGAATMQRLSQELQRAQADEAAAAAASAGQAITPPTSPALNNDDDDDARDAELHRLKEDNEKLTRLLTAAKNMAAHAAEEADKFERELEAEKAAHQAAVAAVQCANFVQPPDDTSVRMTQTEPPPPPAKPLVQAFWETFGACKGVRPDYPKLNDAGQTQGETMGIVYEEVVQKLAERTRGELWDGGFGMGGVTLPILLSTDYSFPVSGCEINKLRYEAFLEAANRLGLGDQVGDHVCGDILAVPLPKGESTLYLCNQVYDVFCDSAGKTLSSKFKARTLRDGVKDETRVLSVQPLIAMSPQDLS
eukprot:COSAG03_NODE_193_length_10859_cov_5.565771_10_plen_474_part_00